MILQELVGVKKYRDLQQVAQAFSTESGYKLLSKGGIGYVFSAPGKNEVLKVWKLDTAYEHFVELARKWHRNKHVPRFFTPVKELRLKGATFKYLRMERLEPASSFTFDGKSYSNHDLTVGFTDSLSFKDSDEQLEEVEAYMKRLRANGNELRFFLQTAVSLIYDMLEYGAQDDLKENNLLKRADGTAVITDPGAFGEELELAKNDDSIDLQALLATEQ